MPAECPDCQKLYTILHSQERQLIDDKNRMIEAGELIDDMAKQIKELQLENNRLNGMFLTMRDISKRIQTH
jgi:hypothetical protein